jgi:hypothetical protein
MEAASAIISLSMGTPLPMKVQAFSADSIVAQQTPRMENPASFKSLAKVRPTLPQPMKESARGREGALLEDS